MGELYSLDGTNINPALFLEPYDPAMPGSLPARCMEDRPVDTSHMPHGLQIPGGAAGEAAAFALALEAGNPGAFTSAERTVDEWTDTTSKMLRSKLHENCAARNGRENIIGFIAANPDVVFATANEAQEVTEADFGRIVDAAERITASGLAVVNKLPDSHFVPLQKDDTGSILTHAGRQVLAIEAAEGDHVLLNTHAAWKANTPAYGANVGMYRSRAIDLNNKIGNIVGQPVNEELFMAGATAYLASTIHHLPKLNAGKPPAIVRV